VGANLVQTDGQTLSDGRIDRQTWRS